MRVTRRQLRQLINEELTRILSEAAQDVIVFLQKGRLVDSTVPDQINVQEAPAQITLGVETSEVTLSSDAEAHFFAHGVGRDIDGPSTVDVDELRDDLKKISQRPGHPESDPPPQGLFDPRSRSTAAGSR